MASTDTAANSEVTSTSDNTASAGGKDIFLPITYTNIGVLAFIATGSAIISAMYYIIVVCIPVHMVVGAIIENVLDKLSMRSPPDAAAMAESGMAQQNVSCALHYIMPCTLSLCPLELCRAHQDKGASRDTKQ